MWNIHRVNDRTGKPNRRVSTWVPDSEGQEGAEALARKLTEASQDRVFVARFVKG